MDRGEKLNQRVNGAGTSHGKIILHCDKCGKNLKQERNIICDKCDNLLKKENKDGIKTRLIDFQKKIIRYVAVISKNQNNNNKKKKD